MNEMFNLRSNDSVAVQWTWKKGTLNLDLRRRVACMLNFCAGFLLQTRCNATETRRFVVSGYTVTGAAKVKV